MVYQNYEIILYQLTKYMTKKQVANDKRLIK